jgi:hypothetical protein
VKWWHAGCAGSGVPTPTRALGTLIRGPISAVKGAVDTVRYAQAFVSHAEPESTGLCGDDDERGLILEEELGSNQAPVVPEMPTEPTHKAA